MSRYDRDVLADPGQHRRRIPTREIAPGMIVEVAADGFIGAAVACSATTVTLRDRRGRERRFGLHPGAFLVDDVRVTLTPPPRPSSATAPGVTNSGSLAVPRAPAKVARAGRILVEGIHDAALVEQVWGDDLRVEGVVVEVLHGIDDLQRVVEAFGPSPQRRIGVLVDHLVPGSKEARAAARVTGPDVLVTGHPFVDVWAAVRPEVVGIDAWPDVPRGEDWKTGTARRLGFEDPRALWRHIAASVTTWRDLDRELIGAVEQLIDHVTAPVDRS
ncbi:MAG: DUF3097 family protein [Nitriliruptor sp.]